MRFDAYLQFRSEIDRAEFVDALRREDPDLADKLHPAESSRMLVVRRVEESECEVLEKRVRGDGRIFRTIPLHPLA